MAFNHPYAYHGNDSTLLYRLQAELAETTDPDMQLHLQSQINTQQNILNDIQQQANLTQEELNNLTTQAQSAAEGNPINLETDAELEWWIDDLIVTGVSTFGGEIGSIGVSFAAMFNDLLGNDGLAQQQYQWAYENGPLGLTADSHPVYYYGTRGMLSVAGLAATSALAIGTAEFIFFGNGSFMVDGLAKTGRIFQVRHPTSGVPIFRLDYHAFAEGGRKLLHIDSNFFNIKHFPWR